MPLGLTENVMPLKSLMKHHFSYWNGHNLEAQPIDTQISYCWLHHGVSQYITIMVGFKAHNFVASSAPSHCLLQLAPAETLSRIRQERLGKVCEDIPAGPSRSSAPWLENPRAGAIDVRRVKDMRAMIKKIMVYVY